ncbi:MAG: hypothetical protein KIS67_03320 [Verrucomicrobiae bacterium]|nr:hypothetical protein [Verrucomicrobiae bacterium]
MKLVMTIISLALLVLIAIGLVAIRSSPQVQTLSPAEFMALAQSNLLSSVRVHHPAKPGRVDGVPVMLHEVRGTFYQTDPAGQILKMQGMAKESSFTARVLLTLELEEMLTTRTNFSAVSPHPLVQTLSKWFDRLK